MKKSLIIFLSVLSITFIAVISTSHANMFNRFKKGFYFEKYSTVEEAKEELLKLHPIGSDVDGLVKRLEEAGCKCNLMDQDKLESAKENNPKIRHLTTVIHCEVSTGFMNSIVWRAGIMIVENKIDDIGIGKEYMGL